MSDQRSSRPQWKTKTLYSAIAALCANGLVLSQAHALPSCGPIVDSNQGQCTPYDSQDVVVNEGVTIETSDAPAVLYFGNLGFSEGGPILGSLTNNGSILSSGLGEDFYGGFDGNIVAGVQIRGELLGDLTNNGTISGTSANEFGDSYAFGILEGGIPAMQGTIRNAGLISASSTSTATSGTSQALALYVFNSIAPDAVIDNQATGEISATATVTDGFGAAVGVVAQHFLGTLNNDGRITATVNNATNGIASGLYLLQNGGTINNQGTISAVLDGGEGSAAGLFSSYMADATVNNFGTISGASAEGDEGYSIYSDDSEGTGTINNTQSGVLRGRLFVDGSGVDVNNAGLIDLTTYATSSVGGNFTQASTGTLGIMAAGADEDEYSRLVVGGTADIAGKAFVDVKEINTLAAGQTLGRVVSAFELTGNFDQVEDNSALFSFQSLATQGEDGFIDFKIIQSMSAVSAVNDNSNPSARGAADALDTIISRGTSNPNMERLITALGQLGTTQQVSDAASQTTPLLTGNTTFASRAAYNGISGVIESRMDSNRGLSSGDEFYGDRKLWLKTFGSWADQDDRSGVSGFDANTAGVVLGADATISDSARIGVALAYANSNIDSNSNTAPNNADIDMYQVIGYGSHSLDPNTELNFQAGVGQNNTDGKRDVRFLGDTATADYSSLVATAGVGLARTFTLSEKTAFTPSVRTDYTWIKDEGYTEKGSSANLKVDSNTTEQWIVGIDGKLSHAFMPSTRVVANLGLGYDLLNSQSSINAAFAAEPGIGFTTRGLDPSPWRQNAGLGLIHDTVSGIEVSLRYDAEHSEGFVSQTASVKARWDF